MGPSRCAPGVSYEFLSAPNILYKLTWRLHALTFKLTFAKLLNDDELRQELITEGYKQASKYTIEKSSQQLLETWKRLIATRHK